MNALRFIRTYPNGEPLPESGLWFAVNKQGLVIIKDGATRTVPNGVTPVPGMSRPENALHLGLLDGVACIAVTIEDDVALPDGYRVFGLRELYGHVHDDHYAIAGYAAQMLLWQRNSNFCPRCGSPLMPILGEWGKQCPNCGHTMYPPVHPCTITLIHDGARLLMTHKDGWGPRYGLVAGFVEPGESLEESLVREVREEVGVEVDQIEYFRSQPWPFPHQIMVGFYARYAGGDVRIDAAELDDAKWFHADSLPVIPPPMSIARQLIDHWVTKFSIQSV